MYSTCCSIGLPEIVEISPGSGTRRGGRGMDQDERFMRVALDLAKRARDAGEVPPGWVMHADPVHLRPDQDRLLLFDAPSMAITRREADRRCVGRRSAGGSLGN